jgi:hypothetical protein
MVGLLLDPYGHGSQHWLFVAWRSKVCPAQAGKDILQYAPVGDMTALSSGWAGSAIMTTLSKHTQ